MGRARLRVPLVGVHALPARSRRAVKRSGKSRLLGILELILGNTRAVSTANISPASLYRLVDASPGTAVLFDEIDRIPKEKAEELWGLINSGWRLGGKVHRQTGGRGDVLKSFSTFSPKVLAGIGQPLPDTTADRSLPVRMERRLPGETVERLRATTGGGRGSSRSGRSSPHGRRVRGNCWPTPSRCSRPTSRSTA